MSENSEISTAAGRQVAFNFIVRIAGLGMAFVTDLVFARKLGSEQYGIFNLSLSVISVVSLIVMAGFPASVVKVIGQNDGNDQSVLAGYIKIALLYILGAGLITAGILIGASDFLSVTMFKEPRLNGLILPTALQLILFSLCSLWLGIFEGARLSHFGYSIREVFVRMLKIIAFFAIGHWLGYTACSLIWGFFCGQLCAFGIYLAWSRKHWGGVFRITNILKANIPKKTALKEFLAYNSVLMSKTLVSLLMIPASKLILGYYRTAEEIGIYSVALNIGNLLLLGLGAVNVVISPIVAKLYAQKDMERLETLFRVAFNAITTFSIPLFSVMVLYSENLFLLYGPDYVQGKTIMVWVATAFFINAITGSNYPFLIMSQKYHSELGITIFGSGGNLLFCLLLINTIGIVGAAIALCVSKTFIFIYRNIVLFHTYRLNQFSTQSLWFFLLLPVIFVFKFAVDHAGAGLIIGPIVFTCAIAVVSFLIYFFLVSGPGERRLLWNVYRSFKKQVNLKRPLAAKSG